MMFMEAAVNSLGKMVDDTTYFIWVENVAKASGNSKAISDVLDITGRLKSSERLRHAFTVFLLECMCALKIDDIIIMALIYANAVNKRMNNPISKPKKKHTPSSSIPDDNIVDSAMNRGKKNSSRESITSRKTSCSLQFRCQTNHSNDGSDNNASFEFHDHHLHQRIHRSKTSCVELSNKSSSDDVHRKTSHSTSSQSTSHHEGDRKLEICKFDLSFDNQHLNHYRGKRRSVSLNRNQWLNQIIEPEKYEDSWISVPYRIALRFIQKDARKSAHICDAACENFHETMFHVGS
ncbi:hypothetical protein DICVIV_12897 [Dictyocaulus viviparus]|uniref:Uncharacterized protein n=1 Tax=Dictyocaulus viviparus TaxID=29172 RepID=A0A0D8XFA9_DICVI|nr:hypothetical protein DICVIV_12897 [Dictyocaulus viviparus]